MKSTLEMTRNLVMKRADQLVGTYEILVILQVPGIAGSQSLTIELTATSPECARAQARRQAERAYPGTNGHATIRRYPFNYLPGWAPYVV